MLNNKDFDLWADGYDKSVGLSEEANAYPFAGYKQVLNTIYNKILSQPGRDILDIGFSTGTLTKKLYDQGCFVFGQDFSQRMIDLAQEKMPNAKLYQGDFSNGIMPQLQQKKYDAIIATYSLHHLTDSAKVLFIKKLLSFLNPKGSIYIGDVAFQNRAELDCCQTTAGDEWDEDEIYFVFDEFQVHFPNSVFIPCSDRAGVIEIHA